MSGITYLVGDATRPQGSGPRIICHVCNDVGGWGRGFVTAISKRWPEPEADYRAWHRAGASAGFALGATRFVSVGAEIWVANMVAQRGLRRDKGLPPIRYDAVRACLSTVADKARELGASAHMPRIGCGLAGGEWREIEPIIEATLLAASIPVFVYDFEPAR